MKKGPSQTKLDWSRLLGFDQLMKTESFVRSKALQDTQAAKIGSKGSKLSKASSAR